MLYSFGQQFGDGEAPGSGDLVFDQAGNIYGTTSGGGRNGGGTVFELSPSHGVWAERVLYNFQGGADGGSPESGVTLDSEGSLYGTTSGGGAGGGEGCEDFGGCGTVYKLTHSASGWTESIVYAFTGGLDGFHPLAGVIFDSFGSLYGSTFLGSPSVGGYVGGGAAYQLMPSGGAWSLNVLHTFDGVEGPTGNLITDDAGNLYGGTMMDGAHDDGNVFKLTTSGVYTELYSFSSPGPSWAGGALVRDSSGILYGTTQAGEPYAAGNIFQLAP